MTILSCLICLCYDADMKLVLQVITAAWALCFRLSRVQIIQMKQQPHLFILKYYIHSKVLKVSSVCFYLVNLMSSYHKLPFM